MLAPDTTRFIVELRPVAELGNAADAWRDLCARAAEPNVFYEPSFALAAAPALGRAIAVLVWSPDRRLVGLFPLRIVRHRYGLPLPLVMGWTHDYAPLGTPLVDRDRITEAVATFLDHVGADPALPKLMLLPCLAADGPVARALAAEVVRRGGRVTDIEPRRRALLASSQDRETYISAALGKKRRQRLARYRQRLAERGELVCEIETTPTRVARLFTEFLALERSGWKGRAGTAAAQHAEIAAFMRRAITGLAHDGKAIAACLRHDGHSIAAALVIRSGCGAWAWKTAYDEAAARFSPGVQLMIDLTGRLLESPGIAWTDSCAPPDHAMIDQIWSERLALVDRLITLAPGSSFALAVRLERLRRDAIASAKRMRDRLHAVAAPRT